MENTESSPSETPEAEQGQTQNEQEYVALTDATDEDIDAFLEGQLAAEAEDEAYPYEPQEQEAAEPQAEQEAAAKPEAEQEDSQEPKKSEVSEEYVKKLEKRLEQQEAFIKRRGNELGELRKELLKANEKLKEQLGSEDFLSDPSAAVDARIQMRENEEKIDQIESEAIHLQRVQMNQSIVRNHVKPEEWNMQGMVQCLEDDGVQPEAIRQFVSNPYAASDGVTLIQLHKRMVAENAFKQLASYTKKVIQERDELKARPHQVLKQVEKNMRQPASVTSVNGGSNASGGLGVDEAQLSTLSDEELDSLLAQA